MGSSFISLADLRVQLDPELDGPKRDWVVTAWPLRWTFKTSKDRWHCSPHLDEADDVSTHVSTGAAEEHALERLVAYSKNATFAPPSPRSQLPLVMACASGAEDWAVDAVLQLWNLRTIEELPDGRWTGNVADRSLRKPMVCRGAAERALADLLHSRARCLRTYRAGSKAVRDFFGGTLPSNQCRTPSET